MKRILLSILLLLVPTIVSAKQTTTWDFRGSNVPGRWEGKGLESLTPEQNGLTIQSSKLGRMTRMTDLDHPIDVVSIEYSIPQNTEARLLWHRLGTPDDHLVELPITFERNLQPASLHIDLGEYGQWDPHTDRIGIALPAGVQMRLHRITLKHYSLWENAYYSVVSAFKFDTYKAYSVNFLWGPQMTYTAEGVENLFTRFPPLSDSFNWTIYGVLIGGSVIAYTLSIRKSKQKSVVLLLSMMSIIWVLFDLRMGLEMISYPINDHRDYWSQEPGTRTLRDRYDFDDFASIMTPLVKQHDSYVFIPVVEKPFMSVLRYRTYPVLPIKESDADTDASAWLVYKDSGVRFENGKLWRKDQPISSTGSITKEYGSASFLFETQ